MPPESREEESSDLFEETYPSPPDALPDWAVSEAADWRRLDEFDILAKAEERTGLSLWRRFALFHELYHLLYHTKGARFWQHSFVSMESFENRADTFAWAALWPEWEENQYHDWAEAEPWQC